MSIEDATTTITIERPRTPASDPVNVTANADPWDDTESPHPPLILVASGVRATLGNFRRSTSQSDGASREELVAELLCDTVSLRHEDVVTDETTEEQWQVSWVIQRPDSDNDTDHVQAHVLRVVGEI